MSSLAGMEGMQATEIGCEGRMSSGLVIGFETTFFARPFCIANNEKVFAWHFTVRDSSNSELFHYFTGGGPPSRFGGWDARMSVSRPLDEAGMRVTVAFPLMIF
jgi:hypothetical protein